ncbi:tRNA splicing endonuclease subunit sen2 [Exophiala xenobiotica]|uniref:tRNA-intron lyase n=1 Tax=Lithohypha guttulata TaxID=1690604 RepID=A0ABR0K146_9EURO|nr:tRNA splicing endonuclease subunit sen2 [Lithohypha guttulata]KAK5311742.1 tRNA splicing endonuclease subunit sen2 [Exophiala xenobiotica]
MSQITVHPRRPAQKTNGSRQKRSAGPRRPDYNAIHRNLLPVVVHPLPILIPHNPLSLVTIALSYLIQVLAPPKRTTYRGYFSSSTSSIHITDEETQRALWEQGFFGRGSLSRSEPTWLENQKMVGITAEENTDKRRRERRQFKIERAKTEQAEIEEELGMSPTAQTPDLAPMIAERARSGADHVKTNEANLDAIAGVLNSTQPRRQSSDISKGNVVPPSALKVLDPKDDAELLSARDGHIPLPTSAASQPNGHIEGFEEWKKTIDLTGLPTPPPTSTSSEASQPEPLSRPTKRLQRQKTVRFSPTIEAREFDLSSPVISPIKAPGSSPTDTPIEENKGHGAAVTTSSSSAYTGIKNQEHLQVSLEEAFFLSFSLGVLDVYPSHDSSEPLPPTSLLSLFRRHSYFPARSLSIREEPDDPFMVSYAVYHHYRSMGWVVRSGVKFGVDYLLYNRGPAFSHAEFAVTVLPNYTDGPKGKGKSWWWLHGVNRVQAQVHKSLILCYVDIPSREALKDVAGDDGSVHIGQMFSKYKVRDVNLRRWTPNRSRD